MPYINRHQQTNRQTQSYLPVGEDAKLLHQDLFQNAKVCDKHCRQVPVEDPYMRMEGDVLSFVRNICRDTTIVIHLCSNFKWRQP